MDKKKDRLKGLCYNSNHEKLIKEREYARRLLYEYNHIHPDEKDRAQEIMKKLIKVKGSFHIEAPFYCHYGYNIEVGENFYANFGCVILDVNKVTIGDNVILGPYVQIYTTSHPTEPLERLSGKELSKPIIIGDNVWIGGGAIICPGVKIGNNVTIGAGSVVTKDLPDNIVAAGSPCRIIRKV